MSLTDEETDADTRAPMSLLLRQALDQSSEAVAVYTAAEWAIASTVIYANPALCKLSGYAAEHFVGHSALLLAGARPDAKSLGSILPSTGNDLTTTVQKTRPDGSGYQVEVHVVPLRDAEGRVTHYVATQRAVVAPRLAPDGLLERVRDSSYGLLAAGIAYELGDHLSRCVSGLSAALVAVDAAPGETSPGTSLMIARGYEAAVAMNDTIRGLQSFTAEEAQVRGPVDVHEAIEAALRLVGPVVRERAIIERRYSPVRAVNASMPRLTRLFMDLLRNAGEAIPPSMPMANHITIETQEETAGAVSVTITDTGVGIEALDLPFVCDPFFTTKPDARTRGLGLTAVRSELDHLGGALQIDSAVGRGTRVRLTLKTSLGAVPPPVVAVRLAEKRGRARLLSVADTKHLAREVAQPFMDGDVELTLATWDDALERLALAEPFHLVVCDTRAVRLPEFRERLRELAPDAAPQVFDVSVHAPEDSGVFPRTSAEDQHAAAE